MKTNLKEIHTYLYSEIANNIDLMANLMEDWNVNRGADGEENVFNLTDYVDFHYFATRYGVEKTLKCCQINDNWFGGNNFKEPKEFPKTLMECHKMIDNVIDVEDILGNEKVFGRYFDIVKIKLDNTNIYLSGNEDAPKELSYYVVLQWVSVVFYKAYENNLSAFDDDASVDDIMDMIANLACEFWNIHKKTAWETTFMDYVLHFLINELEIRSTLLSPYVKDYDVLIKWFKSVSGYFENLF